MQVPAEVRPLFDAIVERFRPDSVWLFGSRARGDFRPDSDWDIVVALPEDGTPELLDPLAGWSVQHEVGVPATVVVTTTRDLAASWGAINTLGYVLAREGMQLLG
jgi:predicted nucleotidyltransferase